MRRFAPFARALHRALPKILEPYLNGEPWSEQTATIVRAKVTHAATELAVRDREISHDAADAVVEYALTTLTIDGVSFIDVEENGLLALRFARHEECPHTNQRRLSNGILLCIDCGDSL